METENRTMETTPSPSPALETNRPKPASQPDSTLDAKTTVAKYGGSATGRKRKDGLVPNSPEAIKADKAKDRERKRRQREDPPPLPSVADTPQTPPGTQTVGLPAVDGQPVPWDAATLKQTFDQLIPCVEKIAVLQITNKAKSAKIPADAVALIEKDAQWSDMSKKSLGIALPQVTAKWMNKSGISSEYQPEIMLLTAVTAIFVGHNQVLSRIDKLIAAQKIAPPPEPEKKNE